MSKKRQHYVPQVYMKSWERIVTTLKEPQKRFSGVYRFNRLELSKGDGCNKKSIMQESHTYTLGTDLYFIFDKMPYIENEFINFITNKFTYFNCSAFYDGTIFGNYELIKQYLLFFQDWKFIDNDTGLNHKKSKQIHSELNGFNSYFIEDALSNYIENYWLKVISDFDYYLNYSTPDINNSNLREIEIKVINDLLKQILFLYMRDPQFMDKGVYRLFWNSLENILSNGIDNQSSIYEALSIHKRAIWLYEIYKGLVTDKGFFNNLYNTMNSICQIIVYTPKNEYMSFLTSDTPVFLNDANYYMQYLKGVFCPLTPKLLLFFGK